MVELELQKVGKRHNFELVNFWKPEANEDLRRVKLIYEPAIKQRVDSLKFWHGIRGAIPCAYPSGVIRTVSIYVVYNAKEYRASFLRVQPSLALLAQRVSVSAY